MNDALRVFVTGGNGVLGRALRAYRPQWTYAAHGACDVTSFRSVTNALHAVGPHIVLHAAALTDHQHPNASEVIETNIIGTENVARAAAFFGAALVYTSTHYVYDGAQGNYAESDLTHPIGTYAWSKFAGERIVQAVVPNACLVVRGSWYTRATRLDRWAERGALTDAWCSREPVEASARKIVALVEAGVRGVVNIGGPRRTFAEILRDEGYSNFRTLTRAEFDNNCWEELAWQHPTYPFPRDVSVNTQRWGELKLNV